MRGVFVIRVWRQEPSAGVAGCTVLEVEGGPKAYARIFDGTTHLEWGWVLHESAVEVWRLPAGGE